MNNGKIITRLAVILPVLLYVALLITTSRSGAQTYDTKGLLYGTADVQASAAPPVNGQYIGIVNNKIAGIPVPSAVSTVCPAGTVANGVTTGVPNCISQISLLMQVTFAGLQALGQFSTPLPYWCKDCSINSHQCMGGGAGAMAFPIATNSATATATSTAAATGTPIPTSTATTAAIIVFACPNLAASVISSPSATPTPALTLTIAAPLAFASPAIAMSSSPVGGSGSYTYAWTVLNAVPTTVATATTQNPTFTLATPAAGGTPGIFEAELTVTDTNSATAKAYKTILSIPAASYYVASTGSDANNGTSAATPFLTLPKCQTAMRGGATKFCIVNDSAVHLLAANLNFTSADNTEVWIPGPGQAPVIDGASSFQLNGQGMTTFTMAGFTFKHLNPAATGTNAGVSFSFDGTTFANTTGLVFRWNTIDFTGVTLVPNGQLLEGANLQSALIDSNTFSNQLSPIGAESNNGQGLEFFFGSSNDTFSHNLCTNMYGPCMTIQSSSGNESNNITVDRNIALNVNQQTVDQGAFYDFDPVSNPGPATGVTFTNNNIFGNISNHGQPTGTSAFYLDTFASHVTISGNICNNCGNWPVQTNSLNNDTITNNIWDISGNAPFNGVTAGFVTLATNNASSSFTHNIIFDSGAWPTFGATSSIWYSINSGLAPATISNNTYWSPTGTAPNPTGLNFTVTDASPTNANPGFTNPSLNNYTMSNPPAGFSALATDQGPLNSPFIQAGSPGLP